MSASTDGSTATITITCHGSPGQACAGGFSFTAHRHMLGTRVLAMTARASKRRKPKPTVVAVALGSGSYRVAAGASERIPFSLNRTGGALLGRFYRLPSTLAFSPTSGSGIESQTVQFSYRRFSAGLDHFLLAAGSSSTAVRSWSVTGVPSGGTVLVKCRGGGCPYRSRSFAHRSAVSILKGAQLSVGAIVQVGVSAPNSVGPAVTVTIERLGTPKEVFSCLPPGAKAPASCTG